MAADELSYYEQRAQAELELAQHATHAGAVQAHYEMATAYLDRIHGEEIAARSDALAA
jgi:hypothetical protein